MALTDKITIRMYGQNLTLSVMVWLDVLEDLKPDCLNAGRIRLAIGEPELEPAIDVDQLERERAAAGLRHVRAGRVIEPATRDCLHCGRRIVATGECPDCGTA